MHTDEVHTVSGVHAKVLRTWASWAAEHGVAARRPTAEAAKRELGQAVDMLCAGARRKPKLPW